MRKKRIGIVAVGVVLLFGATGAGVFGYHRVMEVREEQARVEEAGRVQLALEEAKRKAEEEQARLAAEEAARLAAEEAARMAAEEQARIEEEQRAAAAAAAKKAEEEARMDEILRNIGRPSIPTTPIIHY